MLNQETVSKDMVLKRLKRVEGQLRGVQKMIVEDRDCESIVLQLSAVRSAIESAGSMVLNNYMKLCFLREEVSTQEALDSFARVISIWGRVRVGDKK